MGENIHLIKLPASKKKKKKKKTNRKQSYSFLIKKISIIYHICILQNWCPWCRLLCPLYINPDEDIILRSLRSLTNSTAVNSWYKRFLVRKCVFLKKKLTRGALEVVLKSFFFFKQCFPLSCKGLIYNQQNF